MRFARYNLIIPIIFCGFFSVFGKGLEFLDFTELPSMGYSMTTTKSNAYILCDEGKLLTLEMTQAGHLSVVDTLSLGKFVSTNSFIRKGGCIYVVDSNNLVSIDISSSVIPKITGRYSLENSYLGKKLLSNWHNYLYSLSPYTNYLSIIDLTDSLQPKTVNSFQYDTSGYDHRTMVAAAGRIFIPHYDTPQIDIVNVSNPLMPTTTQFTIPISGLHGLNSIEISGSYAFITATNMDTDTIYEELCVLEISDPDKPNLVGVCKLLDGLFYFSEIKIVQQMAYVLSDSRLTAVSIADPRHPVVSYHIGNITSRTLGILDNIAIIPYEVSSGAMKMNGHKTGVMSFSISEEYNPPMLGTASPFPVFNMCIDSGYMYTAAGKAGINILDISNPTKAVRMGNCATAGEASGVALSDHFLYTAQSVSGLAIIDIKDKVAPVLSASVDIDSIHSIAAVQNIAIDKNYAALISGRGELSAGLSYMKIDSPTSMHNFSVIQYGNPTGVAFTPSSLIMTDFSIGLLIMKLPFPEPDPLFYGSVPTMIKATPGNALGLTVKGNKVYIADGDKGMTILDISNPDWPAIIGTYPTPGIATTIAVSEKYAFIGDSWNCISIFDISDAALARKVGSFWTQSCPITLKVYKCADGTEYLYSAEGAAGLKVIRIPENLASGSKPNTNVARQNRASISGKAYLSCKVNTHGKIRGNNNNNAMIFDIAGRRISNSCSITGNSQQSGAQRPNVQKSGNGLSNGVYIIVQ
jgi:hypothetical protein